MERTGFLAPWGRSAGGRSARRFRMARANSMRRRCAGAAIVVPGAERHERNVIPTPCGLVNYFHKVVDPPKVDHRPRAGEEISAGNEKRVAGGGDPFSLRESKDPQQTTTTRWCHCRERWDKWSRRDSEKWSRRDGTVKSGPGVTGQ